jgi:nucleoside-diphosphate-sugar epimerase
VYGPGTTTEGDLLGRLVRDHLAWRLPGLVGADRLWSFSYIDDVANAHVAALKLPPRSDPGLTPADEIAIGGENAPQMRAFEILRELTGARLPLRIPFPVAEVLAGMEEARSSLFKQPPLLTRGVVEIFRHDWPLDHAQAAAVLGYSPTPLAAGLRQTFG